MLKHALVVTDALTGVWVQLVVGMSFKLLCVEFLFVPLIGRIIVFRVVDIFANVRVIVEIGMVSALKVVVPASYTFKLQGAVAIDRVLVIGVGIWARIDASMWDVTMTALESISVMTSSEAVSLRFGWKACICWPITTWYCALHAWTPSYHVCSRSALLNLPQFSNQEPPGAQQLSLPDLLMMPHAGHTSLKGVVVAVDVGVRRIVKHTTQKHPESHYLMWTSMHMHSAIQVETV